MFKRNGWRRVAAQQGEELREWGQGNNLLTLVLWVNDKNGATRTERITGHWTLDQLEGNKTKA